MAMIYLVRHGRTGWNREEIFRGRADISLDEFGRRQAQAVADSLAGQPITAIFTSPLSRARETAAAVAARAGLDYRVEEGLTDIDYGAWQGLPDRDVASRYPELYRLWHRRPQEVRFPEGESLEAVAGRAWPVLQRVATDARGATVVVVAHRVVNKVLLCRVLGLGLEAFWRIRQDTACVNLVEHADKGWIVHRLNDTCHLTVLGAAERVDF